MQRDDRLARLIEDFHERQARGLKPEPEDFRESAGDLYDEFVAHLAQEAAFDRAISGDEEERLPRILGDYTLLALLGRGGYGDIYRATQRSLARTVALKVLRGGWAKDSDTLARFQRGAKAAAQVEHDHVVRIYDYGVLEGRPFIAMSLVTGPTLSQVYKELRACGGPPFGPAHHEVLTRAGVPGEGADTASFVRRLAALLAGPAHALQAYHADGIFHRDVKPGNLIMSAEGRLVLTDFDLSKRLDDSFRTASGSTLGTPHYMSPEQWNPREGPVDGRADIYGLGAVFYEGVTLRRPFEEYELGRLMTRVVVGKPQHPRTFTPDLPDGAGPVAMKALERRPADRYHTAEDLAHDLERLAKGAPVEARALPVGTRGARWAWRNKGYFVLTLIGLALFFAWWSTRPGELHITPYPRGCRITLNGEHIGLSPKKNYRAKAGQHTVELSMKGYLDAVEELELTAGGSASVDVVLKSDPNEPRAAISHLVEDGLAAPRAGSIPTERAVPSRGKPVFPLLPRGKVTKSGLKRWYAEANEPMEATLVFEAGERTLHRAPFSVERLEFDGAIPPEVVARLQAGQTCRWGFVTPAGERWLAEIEIVDELAPGDLAAIDARIHPEDVDLRRYFTLALLEERGRYTAVVRDARALAAAWQEPELLVAAWRGIERLGLEETRLANRVRIDYGRR